MRKNLLQHLGFRFREKEDRKPLEPKLGGLSSIDEYALQIEEKDSIAIRKLELLLVGCALRVLNLENSEIPSAGSGRSVSVDSLVSEELLISSKYRLVHHKTGKVYGFTSSKTFLYPVPETSDQDWRKLWEEVNDYASIDTDWQKSEDWKYRAKKARYCIAAWLKRLQGEVSDNNCWKVLVQEFEVREKGNGIFGIAGWIPLSSGQGKILIPLPVYGDSIGISFSYRDEFVEYDDPDDEEICDYILGFDKVRGYKRIRDLPVVDSDHNQNMMWREHLDKLQEKHQIFAWWSNSDGKELWIMKDLRKKIIIHIKNLRVIDEDSIQIDRCIPLIQRPVPGSDVKQNTFVFPDLPLLPEYISLVEAPPDRREGRLVDSNWKGIDDISSYELDEKNNKVTWRYHVAGRTEPVEKKIDYTDITPAEAHWMVWPNFKAGSSENSQWRAYYIYEHSTRESLEAKPIVLNEQGSLLMGKRSTDSLGPGRAVGFDSEKGVHTGGAPVALCAYDHEKGENLGIYKVRLKELHRADSSWKIAIDFGTSHTVAAVENRDDQDGEMMCKPISIEAELTSGSRNLSLHISENWPRDSVEKSEMKLDLWRPTYTRGSEKKEPILRSDIWSLEAIDFVNIPTIEQSWAPMTHYTIPPMRLERRDSVEHIVSGFKGKMSGDQFSDKQYWLQKKYLGMAIEILVADVVRDRGKLPTKIQFTFTYPLRGVSSGDTERYENSIRETLECSRRDMGYEVIQGQGLLYSESHTAADAVGAGRAFEVKLVADLSGETLDTYISTSDVSDKHNRFKEKVADSARLGTDILLKILAGGREKYLPGTDRGWGKDDITCFQNLRDWVRSEGADKLFGNYSNWEAKGIGLRGFEDLRFANDSRILIDRYFRVIADFLARSLVAYTKKYIWNRYLSNEIVRHEFEDIKLIISPVGNGWHLWYGNSEYDEIQQTIVGWIRERAKWLWERADVSMCDQPSILEDLWHESDRNSISKVYPICNAVGKNHNPYEISDIHKFPLSKVILRCEGEQDKTVDWFETLPFRVKYPETIKIEVVRFDPPLCIDSLEDSDSSIEMIEDQCMKSINDGLEDEKLVIHETIDTPVAALIWENLLRSSRFQDYQAER